MIFRAKGALRPKDLVLPSESVRQKRRKPGSGAQEEAGTPAISADSLDSAESQPESTDRSPDTIAPAAGEEQATATNVDIVTEGVAKIAIPSKASQSTEGFDEKTEEMLYCPECYLPLHPDPNPEKLYIFLHAIRYTTSLGSFETDMPEWAAPDFRWER